MHNGYNYQGPSDKESQVLAGGNINGENPEENTEGGTKSSSQGVNLFADANVPSFFR
jgi:hypothetical protein